MTTLTLINLSKEYTPGYPALDRLNLTVGSGELLALLGPSGAGKTTLLRLITGLMEPSSGDLLFDGRSILNTPVEKRGAVMVFQEHSLFPFMSVGGNVAYGLKLRGIDPREIQTRVATALSRVQLQGFESRRPDQLSGGQRQRVALAQALVIRPRVLLLDEPLSNLESGLRSELREMIRNIQKESGITMIYVTHDQEDAVAIADRIALLKEGRLRQVGPPRCFFVQPADAEVASFFGGSNFLQGVKRGVSVETALGSLEVQPGEWPDGEILLTIRPEAIEVGGNGYNNLDGTVRSRRYRGAMTLYNILVNGVDLEIVARPFQLLEKGERVTLHIPRERICFLPTQPQ